MENILKLIEQYDIITIFRHEFADPDALGSQFGLYEIIIDNFKNKDVYVLGKEVKGLSDKLFCKSDTVDDEIVNNSLAIVLDTANTQRIDDQRYKNAKEILKIDHHPEIERYGTYNFVDTTSCATSFIIAKFAFNFNLHVNNKAATFLYTGIVGDTNRFFHNNTTKEVFDIAAKLVECNADIQKVYQEMYSRNINEVRLTAYILDNFKLVYKKIAYYILNEEDYHKYGITFEKAKEYVNTLASIDGVDIWLSCTYNPETKFYHVSIRSKNIVINDVAQEFGGGGHHFASGVKVSTIERFMLIIEKLSNKI